MSRSVPFGDDLDRRLIPFLAVMGHSTRRRWGPLYVRGLLGPDGPKSVQPIAERLGLRSHDQLRRLISSSSWDGAPLWRVLAERADAIVGADDAVLVVDDTATPKKGTLSGKRPPDAPVYLVDLRLYGEPQCPSWDFANHLNHLAQRA